MRLDDPGLDAAAVIAALRLETHPEGGHYREVWRDLPEGGGRGAGTAIHFLLEAGARSHWHRVDAAECWIWQGGGPLMLALSKDGTAVDREVLIGPAPLGAATGAGQVLMGLVPAGWWQAAWPVEDRWSLVSCTVAPAFRFEGFELAPPGWKPGS